MARRKEPISPAAFLYALGGRICFRPVSSFHTAAPEKKEGQSKIRALLLPYKRKVKFALSKAAEQSFLLEFLHRFLRSVFTQRIRALGVFFFSSGFFQILSYFAADFLPLLTAEETNLVFGVVQIFLALICSFTRGDVAGALKRSFLYRGILRQYFGIQEWQLPGGKSRDNLAVMFFCGLVAGVLSLFVSSVSLAKIILLIALALFVFYSPEAGLILGGAGAFFLSFEWVRFFVFLTVFSFVCKCFLGKRSLVFSPMDGVVLLFFLPFFSEKISMFSEGIFSLFLLYLLTSCLIRTVSSVRRLLAALSSVSVVMAFLLILRQLLVTFAPEVFLRVEGMDKLFFVKPTAQVGLLLAMSIPLMMGLMQSASTGGKRIFRFVSFVFQIAGLFLIQNATVWVAAILGMVIFFLFSYRSSLIVACIAGLSLTTVFRVLPRSMMQSVLSFFGMNVESLHPESAAGGSFLGFLQSNAGAIWPFLFFAVGIFFVFECVFFCTKTTRAEVHSAILGVLCSVMVFFGVSFQNLLPDYRCFALLMMMLALPRAAHRAAAREEVLLPY